jgi:hypothetical protein
MYVFFIKTLSTHFLYLNFCIIETIKKADITGSINRITFIVQVRSVGAYCPEVIYGSKYLSKYLLKNVFDMYPSIPKKINILMIWRDTGSNRNSLKGSVNLVLFLRDFNSLNSSITALADSIPRKRNNGPKTKLRRRTIKYRIPNKHNKLMNESRINSHLIAVVDASSKLIVDTPPTHDLLQLRCFPCLFMRISSNNPKINERITAQINHSIIQALHFYLKNAIFVKLQIKFIMMVRVHARASIKLEDILRLIFKAGELAIRWNQIYLSLLNMFEKLKKLGFTYYNGKVSTIEIKEGTNA